MNSEFYHQTVTPQQIEDYISEASGIDLTEFFNQYLRGTKIPTLEYKIENGALEYRWTNSVAGFDMPIQIEIDGKTEWLYPKADWQSQSMSSDNIAVDRNFYVEVIKL